MIANTSCGTELRAFRFVLMPQDAYYSSGHDTCENVESCLGAKLSKLAPITTAQEKLLAELENEQEDVDPHTVLYDFEKPADELMVLKKGWALAESRSENGRRNVTQIFHPGDVVGMAHLPFQQTKDKCVSVSKLVVCRFPRNKLDKVMRTSPRLSGLLLALSMIEQAVISDRTAIARHNDSLQRLALFLMQTLTRLRLMNKHIYDQFHCPLKQTDLGAATGLTSEHVSRMFKRLEQMGLIARNKRFIRILDEPKLRQLIGYTDRFSGLNLDWIPEK